MACTAEIEEAIIIIGMTRSGSFAAKGMAPSVICVQLVIALATTFFPKGFSEEERAAGMVKYILGCTHITDAVRRRDFNMHAVAEHGLAGSACGAVMLGTWRLWNNRKQPTVGLQTGGQNATL